MRVDHSISISLGRDGNLDALVSVSSLEEATSFLKNKYEALYQEILQLDSSCLDLTMGQVLDRLSTESDSNGLLCVKEHMNKRNKRSFHGGVLLHDLSGVGLYTLAYHLANAWAKNESFTKYKAVIVLPIEQMHHYMPEDADTFSIKDLFAVWGIDIGTLEIPRNDLLVIASGCSEKLRVYDTTKLAPEKWVKFSQNFPHIIVSNSPNPEYLAKAVSSEFQVSLSPFNLRIDHLKGRPGNGKPGRQSTCYIPGKLIIDEAQATIEQIFFHPQSGKLEGSVWTTENWHEQTKRLMQNGAHIHQSNVKIDHIYHVLNLQGFLRSILNPDIDATEFSPRPLDTPARWFGAAITAEIGREFGDKKHYATYRIESYFLARDLSNNYIVNLNHISEVSKESAKKSMQMSSNPLKEDLRALVDSQEPSFDDMTEEQIGAAIKGFGNKSALNYGFKARNAYGPLMEAIQDRVPKKFHDSTKTKEAEGVSYREIQERFNESEKPLMANVASQVRKILKGKTTRLKTPDLVLGITALMMAESHRYPPNFLVTLCLFDLLEEADMLWSKLFYSHDVSTYSNEITDGIITGIRATLAGLHPMSQGNSRNQVKERAIKPKYGMHLVDFKSHIILMKWLAVILEREPNVAPHLSAEIVSSQDGPVVDDIFTWFMKNAKGSLNPYMFDRFSRRLDTFDFLLVERQPIRNLFPNNHIDDAPIKHGDAGYTVDPTKIIEFMESQDCHIRNRLPRDDFKGLTGFTNNHHLSLIKRLEFNLFMGPNEIKEYPDDYVSALVGRYLAILAIDPDFYQMHNYIANTYLLAKCTVRTIEKALKHATCSLELATAKDSFYYTTLSLRIKCNFLALFVLRLTGNYEQFTLDVQEYLANYKDASDPDHWRVYAYRAILNFMEMTKQGKTAQAIFSNESLYQDFSMFLKNVEFIDDLTYELAIKYMKGRLEEALDYSVQMERCRSQLLSDHRLWENPSMMAIHSLHLFRVADIYHCLGKYEYMLTNAFEATMIVCQHQSMCEDDLLELIGGKLATALQTYYSKNNLCYSSHYAQELWNGMLAGAISNTRELNEFLETRKTTIDPNVTFISMRLVSAPQPVPTSRRSTSISAETILSSDILPIQGVSTATMSFSSKMAVLKGYQANSNSFAAYERDRAVDSVNIERLQLSI